MIGTWMAVWLVSLVYVFSVGEPVPREDYPFITNIKWEDNTRYVVFYQVFMLFWMNAFIMGICQFIIAAAACIWYFEVESDTQGKGCVGRAVRWSWRYHIGSVAFGSACIAICQMIRFVFEYYRKKIESMTQNPCVKCLICYTRYLLYLLEKCIKFITKNAYIQVALTSTYFCDAAWNAFALIIKNVARFGWLNTIGSVLNWLGVCAVTGVNTFICYVILTKVDSYKEKITQPLAPTILIACISFLLVKSFLSIIDFSLDAILQAFLLDESLADPSRARPEHMQKFFDGLQKHTHGDAKELEMENAAKSASPNVGNTMQ